MSSSGAQQNLHSLLTGKESISDRVIATTNQCELNGTTIVRTSVSEIDELLLTIETYRSLFEKQTILSRLGCQHS